MRCYLISDTQITVLSSAPASVPIDTVIVNAVSDLDQNRFPVIRLVELWNGLSGAEPIRRFRDRHAALKRLWAAMEALPISSSRTDSKQAQLIALLRRPSGASIDELISATGWQPHSVRGVLSGVVRKKLGLNVVSVRDGNSRTYRIAP
jgi:hypothetical protein